MAKTSPGKAYGTAAVSKVKNPSSMCAPSLRATYNLVTFCAD